MTEWKRNYKTGLHKSADPPKLRFGSYFKSAALPTIPTTFGHYGLIPATGWLMLENDQLSCCTISGAMHAVMMWNAIAGRKARFTNLDTIDDYSDACGYVRGNPATDTGGDMVSVASYWRNVGMRDCTATRHKIAAYLQIEPGNLDHIDAACYLFGAVGLGVALSDSAETQFDAGQPWHIIPNDPPSDYHFVPYVGRDATYRKVVTWGALQEVSDDWLRANLQEVVAYISTEDMINQRSPEGFAYADLQADLNAIA